MVEPTALIRPRPIMRAQVFAISPIMILVLGAVAVFAYVDMSGNGDPVGAVFLPGAMLVLVLVLSWLTLFRARTTHTIGLDSDALTFTPLLGRPLRLEWRDIDALGMRRVNPRQPDNCLAIRFTDTAFGADRQARLREIELRPWMRWDGAHGVITVATQAGWELRGQELAAAIRAYAGPRWREEYTAW